MRKILILLLILLLLFIGYFMVFRGIQVFGVEVLSISQIKGKNEDLDTKLKQLSTLTSVNYPQVVKELNTSSKQLLIEKENYADMVTYSSNEEIKIASQTEKYELEYLWAKIGEYATRKGITLKIEVKNSDTGVPGQYNLNFLATGSYVGISEFIAALEDESTLAFKIEDFRLNPSANSTDSLQANFVVRDLTINIQNTVVTGGTSTQMNSTTTNPTTTTTTNTTH